VFRSCNVDSGARLQVFFWEYFGPLAIMLFFYTRPAFIYGDDAQQAAFEFPAACVLDDACACAGSVWCCSCFCRAWGCACLFQVGCCLLGSALCEALVRDVLRASFQPAHHAADQPLQELRLLLELHCAGACIATARGGFLPKGHGCCCAFGIDAQIAYFLCHPGYSTPTSLEVFAGFALFTVSEILNAAVHLYLRSIRPAVREVPSGAMFGDCCSQSVGLCARPDRHLPPHAPDWSVVCTRHQPELHRRGVCLDWVRCHGAPSLWYVAGCCGNKVPFPWRLRESLVCLC